MHSDFAGALWSDDIKKGVVCSKGTFACKVDRLCCRRLFCCTEMQMK
jgi:hypothetical protein